MFGKLKELFNSDSLLDTAYDNTLTNLDFVRQMFLDSMQVLRKADSERLPYDFKEADRRINKFEREVRRQVVAHMAVSNSINIPAALVLVTIVVDVERLGDFTKNIAELAMQTKEPLHGHQFEEAVAEIEQNVQEQFPIVIDLLRERDREQASDFIANEEKLAGRCNSILQDFLSGKADNLAVHDASRICLYVRYLKRMNAHLTNIASSVVNPFPRIGFREKKPKD